MRKILFTPIIIFGVFLCSFLGLRNVFAQANVSDFYYGGNRIGYERYNPKNGLTIYDYMEYYTQNNVPAYCIQPGVKAVSGNMFSSTENWSSAGLTEVQKNEITKIAYYGYSYPGHNDLKYYMAAQGMIWDILINAPGGHETRFDNNLSESNLVDISQERATIKQLVDNHEQLPSFAYDTKNTSINQSVTFTDNKGILSKFQVSECTNCNASIVGNNLNVTPTSVGNYRVKLTQNFNQYNSVPIYFVHGTYQNQVIAGNLDPVQFSVSGDVTGGSLTLKKYDQDNKTCNPRTGGSLQGAVYKLYKEDNTFVKDLTIGSDCSAKADGLELGRYYVQESKAGTNYQLDSEKHYFDLNSGNTNVEVVVYDKIILGSLNLKKYDQDNKTCNPRTGGSLQGAVYKLYKENGTFVKDLTIGSDCSAKADGLELGRYYVLESKAGTNYQLDPEKHYFDLNANQTTVELKVYDKIILGSLNLKKYDQDSKTCTPKSGGSLQGAEYKLYKEDNTFVKDLTIGSDCGAKADNLELGRYYVQETKAGTNYQLDTEKHYFDLNAGQTTVDLVVYDKMYLGQVKIIKYDRDNNSCTPRGNAQLKGAVYGIYKGTELISQLTIGEDCSATSERNLLLGEYTIKEISAPKGYILDKNSYKFQVTTENGDSLIEVNVNDKVITTQLHINKTYLTQNEVYAEVGATFEIISKTTNKVVATLVIDETGTSSVTIPYDDYIIRQTKGKEYFIKAKDIELSVDENVESDTRIFLLNKPFEAKLKVIKIDSESKKNIAFAGIVFKIKNLSTNEYVCQKVTYPKNETICEYSTDENGELITPYALEGGTYELEEIKAPKNYLLSKNKIIFTVDEETSERSGDDLIVVVKAENQQIKGQISVEKTGEVLKAEDGTFSYEEKKLDNVEFTLYANEDIVTLDGVVHYKKGEKIKSLVTDVNGSVLFDNLYLGKYMIKETKTLDNYVLDETEHYVELLSNDNEIEIVSSSLQLKNKIKKGRLEFTKTDFVTGEVIPNTVIEIYTENDELIYTGKTDETGKITIEELSVGKYYILEKEAATGYLITDEKVFFEIKENGEIVKAEMKDKPITGKLEFTKTDFVTGEVIPNTVIEIYTENDELIYTGTTNETGKITIEELRYGKYYILEKEAATGYLITDEKVFFEIKENGEIVKAEMKDKPITGKLEFTKTDFVTGEVVPNTVIEIYTENDELIYTGKTDETGKITIEELRYGKYYILEKEAATGYLITDEKVLFEIKENGEIVKAEMKDKPITGKLEFTKTDLSTSEALPNTLIEIYTDKGELVFSGRTDEKGQIIIEELRYGKYYILEKEAPSGYVLNSEKMFFEIKENGEVVKANMVNEKVIVDVPNTGMNDNYFVEILGAILCFAGLGVIIYELKKRK